MPQKVTPYSAIGVASTLTKYIMVPYVEVFANPAEFQKLSFMVSHSMNNAILFSEESSDPINKSEPRLAGRYLWQEFPAVTTGNYHPGKYSKFWAKWEILGNMKF